MSENISALVERLDKLYGNATKGLWTQGARYLCALPDGGLYDELATICDSKELDSVKWNANTKLIVALHNAWPDIRRALSSLSEDAGRYRWLREHCQSDVKHRLQWYLPRR